MANKYGPVVPIAECLERMPAELRPAVEAQLAIDEIMFPDIPRSALTADDKLEMTKYAVVERDAQARRRFRAQAILLMRERGYSVRDIARMIGSSPKGVAQALYRARKAGRLDDLRGVLEHDSLALAVDGLNHHLRAKDKEAIFETLKGLGQFRQYHNNKHDGMPSGGMPPLTVNIVNAAPGSAQALVVSEPMGTPRED